MKNLKIANKLFVGFGAVLLMFLLSIIFSAFSLRSVANSFDTFYNKPFVNVNLATTIDMNSEVAAKYMLRACVDQNAGNTETFLNYADSCIEQMKSDLATLEVNYTGDVNDVKAVTEWVTALEQTFDTLSQAARSNNVTVAYNIYAAQVANQLTGITDTVDVVQEHANNAATEFHDAGINSSQLTLVVLIIVGLVSLIVGLFLSRYIQNLITVPIQELKHAAEAMHNGQFDAQITYQSNDELGDLADSMRGMIEILKLVIQDISLLVGKMADGNLDVHTDKEKYYVGELRAIVDSVRKMRLNLNHTLSNIITASDQVNASSDQVSSGAQSLAQGATEQASAVQELAATISEITNGMTTTAEHANTAKVENVNSDHELQNCAQHMNNLVSAMHIIEEKSKEVSKISKTIEDIAFQTNILALNAAVEAARAGNAGKGFAVVADEVRNLATKSQEAAKSTTMLIEETIRAVKEGTNFSSETENSLSAVVKNAKSVLDAVVNIADTIQQQTLSIQQINQGIDQISSVVQTNSATAEESAAASEELSGQAELMKNLISVFTLDEKNLDTATN